MFKRQSSDGRTHPPCHWLRWITVYRLKLAYRLHYETLTAYIKARDGGQRVAFCKDFIAVFTGLLAGNGIAISMDGKGAWRDNVFVERLWRSVKYEEVYLRAYQSVSEARSSIGRYLDFYNRRRPHSSLDGSTPDQAYFNLPPFRAAA